MKANRLSCEILSIFIIVFATLAQDGITRIVHGRPRGGLLGAPEVPVGARLPEEKWYELQSVDHFNGKDNRYWKQRYFINDTFHKPGGPIFLMLGGEAEANPVWMIEGAWVHYAQMYDAIMVMLEHRFYGKSQPTPNLSTDNLRYLSSEQALADVASFVAFFRLFYSLNETHKLIVFGGSYSGSLAAWFRSKYPCMVDGAVASSAPVVAEMDFLQYFEVVKASLDTTGPRCAMEIKNATDTIFEWKGQPKKRKLLEKMFQLCDKINNDNIFDEAGLFSNLAQNFALVVQYNKDNRKFEGVVGTNLTVETVCNIMTDETRGSSVQRYADVNSLILKTFSKSCLDFTYHKLLHELKQTEWNSTGAEGGRQWLYQSCAELGWSQSSGSFKQPFGNWWTFPWNYTLDQCIDVFQFGYRVDNNRPFRVGETLPGDPWENVDETNRYYGGLKLPVSNIVFPNGEIDPWHALGVTSDLSPDATAIYIKGAAHCADIYPPSDHDSPDLTAARQKIAQLIGKWLSI